MKKYDFETLLDRRCHDAMAVDAIGNPKYAASPSSSSPASPSLMPAAIDWHLPYPGIL